jgi:diacylglycerol O-acyltransferase
MHASDARPAHEPLSAEDWMFLACEGRDTPMHVGATLLLAPGAVPIDLDRLRRYLGAHIGDVPRYRQRLAYTPLDRRPVWVDDADFELRAHVRRATVAPPGDDDAFRGAVGRILSLPLDRDRPLWECWLVDGRADGRVGVVMKIHHCMVDGVAGADLLALLLSVEPHTSERSAPPWTPRPAPPARRFVAEALARPVRLALAGWREMARIAWDPRRLADWTPVARAAWHTVETGVRRAPASPLNRPIGSHRRVAYLSSDLARTKAIKARLGGTVNDVVLTAVAGGLRRFLLARDPQMDLLDLRGLVPVDRRGVSGRGRLGNHLSGWILSLPVSIEDPLARHAEVCRSTAHLKRTDFARTGEVLLATNGTLLGAALQLVERLRPFNVTVSNIPGPPLPLFLLDARLEAAHPHVPLFRGQGLSIAVFSYAGSLHWGFTGECQVMPDLDGLAAAVASSLLDLEARAGVLPSRPPVSVRWTVPVVLGADAANGGR